MKIEFIFDGKDFSKDLFEKSCLIANALAELLFEVEIFKYLESHKITLSNILSPTIPTAQQDMFIEEITKSTDVDITMFLYKTKEVPQILISLRLVRIFHGYSTSVSSMGQYIWTITSEKIVFEKIN